MGHYMRSRDLFEDVIYNKKSTAELREAMSSKVAALGESVTAREARLLRIRDEFAIDPERLAELILRFKNNDGNHNVSYENQGNPDAPLVPAGVIANIVREREMIDTERDQTRKMELILRNLRDTESYVHEQTGEVRERPCVHELTDHELEYLGF